jgi:hypothetical protein
VGSDIPKIHSLGDILRSFHLFYFVAIMNALRTYEEGAARVHQSGRGEEMPDKETVDSVREAAEKLQDYLEEIEFDAGVKRIKGPFLKAVKEGITWRDLRTQLKVLREAIDGDLQGRWFAVISAEKGKLVFGNYIFWDPVDEKFPSATYDITEAQLCYGLERNTATVFHCMRIAEIGLRSLARRMKVKLPKRARLEWAEWQTVLREMSKVADAIAGTKKAGPAKDELLDFYRGALGQFYGFKDEYRNHVMHTRSSYDEHRAASVLLQVRDFMVKLSMRIDERGRSIKYEKTQ